MAETYGFAPEPEDDAPDAAAAMLGERMSALSATIAVLTDATIQETEQSRKASRTGGDKTKVTTEKTAGGGGIGDVFGKLFSSALAKMAMVFGPLIAFSSVLNSVTAGFQPFLKAMQVVASVIGTLLLPFFMVLGAALLTASDIIFTRIKPALGDFYEFVMTALKPGLLALLEGVEDLAEGLRGVLDWIGRNVETAQTVGETASEAASTAWEIGQWLNPVTQPMKIFDAIGGLFGGGGDDEPAKAPPDPAAPPDALAMPVPKEPTARERRRQIAEEAFKGFNPGKAGDREQKFDQNMKVMIESFARSMGPKATYQSITEANKQVQLAAINQDPIDAKQLQVQLQTLEVMRKVEAKITPPTRPRYDGPGERFDGPGAAGVGEDF